MTYLRTCLNLDSDLVTITTSLAYAQIWLDFV
jgi:hypothetical protein